MHATELSDNLLTVGDCELLGFPSKLKVFIGQESKPLESFKEGQEVEGVVIGFRQSRTNQYVVYTVFFSHLVLPSQITCYYAEKSSAHCRRSVSEAKVR